MARRGPCGLSGCCRVLLLVAASLAAWGCRRPPAREALVVALPFAPAGLDPHAAAILADTMVLGNVYEPLVTLDDELRPRSTLAESWTNPDPSTWEFKLRPSVRFHAGKALTARDAAFSLERARGAGRGASYYMVDVEQIETIGELGLRIRTRKPGALLLQRLSYVAIVPEGAGSRSMQHAADGTGPYAVAGWKAGRLELRRFPGYWGPRPAVPSVAFLVGRTQEEMTRGLLAGELQMAFLRAWRPSRALLESKRHEIVRRPGLHVYYLGFDVSRERTPFCAVTPNPFRDGRVRRAIHLALDREALVEGLPSWASPVGQLVSRSVFGFDPGIPEPVADLPAARRLLRASGLGAGFGAVLHTRPSMAVAAERVAAQLRGLGLRLEVRALPDPEYFEALGARRLSFWLDNWGCTTGDAGELFENAIHSSDPARALGGFNETGLHDPDLDREIEALPGIQKVAARRAALQRLMRDTMQELPWLPLYTEPYVFALDRSLAWQPGAVPSIDVARITWEAP